jgi:hypothetical protein
VTNRLPLGFASFDQFNLFCRELILAVAAEGARAEAWIIGTAATGFSMHTEKPGRAFSKRSDIDVVLRSLELMQTMKEAGGQADTSWNFQGKHLWLRNDGPNGFLTACSHIAAFATKWSSLALRQKRGQDAPGRGISPYQDEERPCPIRSLS